MEFSDPDIAWMRTAQNDLDSHKLAWTEAVNLSQKLNWPLWWLLTTRGATHSYRDAWRRRRRFQCFVDVILPKDTQTHTRIHTHTHTETGGQTAVTAIPALHSVGVGSEYSHLCTTIPAAISWITHYTRFWKSRQSLDEITVKLQLPCFVTKLQKLKSRQLLWM